MDKYGFHHESEVLERIKEFTLLWNLVENRLFNKKFVPNNFRKHIHFDDFYNNEIDDVFKHFKDRYVDKDGGQTERFKKLKVNKGLNDFVFNRLSNTTDFSNKEIVEAITIIVYRIRCNLFHGEKEIERLDDQTENFYYANKFMFKLIEAYD